jgi:hypothetical protein
MKNGEMDGANRMVEINPDGKKVICQVYLM